MFEGVLGVLVFLGTALVVITGSILAGFAFLTKHGYRAWKIARFLLIWIAVYAGTITAFSLASQPRYIQPGIERCFDEMCYSVLNVTVSPTIGEEPHQRKAQGYYYLITVQLRSAAKRTAQRPSFPTLFVVDASGKQFTRFFNAGSSDDIAFGQPVTARILWDQPVQPGQSLVRKIAVDLPVGIERPGLVLTEGIGPLSILVIGDENSLFHAKTQFVLSQPEAP